MALSIFKGLQKQGQNLWVHARTGAQVWKEKGFFHTLSPDGNYMQTYPTLKAAAEGLDKYADAIFKNKKL